MARRRRPRLLGTNPVITPEFTFADGSPNEHKIRTGRCEDAPCCGCCGVGSDDDSVLSGRDLEDYLFDREREADGY